MKKYFIIALIITAIMFFLVGCSEEKPTTEEPNTNTTTIETNTNTNTTTLHTHEFGAWTVVKNATCTEDGSKERTCACGAKETETVPATGHNYSTEWTIDLEPTCRKEGSKSHHCTVCDAKTDVTKIDKVAHTEGTKIGNEIQATCKTAGTYDEVVYCTVCNKEISRTQHIVNPLSHDFSEWTTGTQATCTEAGTETRTCSACNYTETRPVDALGHDYPEKWTVVSESTETEAGLEEKECSRCHDKIQESLPLLEPHIKLYDYYKTNIVPQIYIETKDHIALDDPSLIDPNEKKGMNGSLNAYMYVDSTISVRSCEGYEFENAESQVKIRGNYTSTYPKKPIRIKFSKKQAMCGLNSGNKLKSWVLLAEYKDPSMLRNSVAAYLGNSLLESNGYYTTDFRYVEVYLNGEYYGLFLLCEQQQINKNRVSVKTEALDPTDDANIELTEAELKNPKVGYLLEYDGYYKNEPELNRFTITYNQIKHINGTQFTPSSDSNTNQGWGWGNWGNNSRVIGFTIKSDVYYTEQNTFIKKCMQTVWSVIYDAAYGNHSNGQPYHTMDADGNYIVDESIKSAYEAISKVVDIDSLIDMYIIQELCEDSDISWSSFYFKLDMSPKGNRLLTYIAPWDFDSALGNKSGQTASNNQLFAMNTDNPWLVVYAYQGWFWEKVYDRFMEAKERGVFSGAVEMIDYYTTNYVALYKKNYDLWQNIGKNIGNELVSQSTQFRTQKDASDYLRNWFIQRVTNMESLFRTEYNKYQQ